MKLHYSQTKSRLILGILLFDNHMKLHYSQTKIGYMNSQDLFDNHMKLHYSQTPSLGQRAERRLTTI